MKRMINHTPWRMVVSAILAVACLGVLSETTASATPPIKTPPAGQILFTVDTSCGPIRLDILDNSTGRVHFDRSGDFAFFHAAGHITATVTSLASGRVLKLNLSGPSKVSADGTITLTGPTLLILPTRLLYVHGRTVFTTPEDLEPSMVNGHVQDLCPRLV